MVVKDHDGQNLAYVYFEDEPSRRSAVKLLTKDKARRIAANIAKLPELFSMSEPHRQSTFWFTTFREGLRIEQTD
jgi:hypothetical protein